MSAHRDPDVVADYAKNAKMRGLRVIIAGAGLSAALPGVVAAHTQLPVIGVPLTSSKSVAGGLDALLSIAQMPPGVPGRVRRRRQRQERRRAGRAHPRRLGGNGHRARAPRRAARTRSGHRRPRADSTQMRPPWRSTIFLQIASPMPVPSTSSWRCRRWSRTKMRSWWRGWMPGPSSETETSQSSPRRNASACTRGAVAAVVLDRVAEQVLQHLDHLAAVGHHDRERAARSPRRRRRRSRRRGCARRRSTRRSRSVGSARRSPRPVREYSSSSAISESMRLAPATARSMNSRPSSSSRSRWRRDEQAEEAGDRAQRLAQVVRGDVGEPLELGVGAGEVGLALAQALRHPLRERDRAALRAQRGAQQPRGEQGEHEADHQRQAS